jgi:hypothetical protein
MARAVPANVSVMMDDGARHGQEEMLILAVCRGAGCLGGDVCRSGIVFADDEQDVVEVMQDQRMGRMGRGGSARAYQAGITCRIHINSHWTNDQLITRVSRFSVVQAV